MSADLRAVALLGVTGAVLVVTAGLVITGPVALPGLGGAVESSGDAETGTPTTASGPPFTLDTRGVEECGILCRNVTSTVTNERDTPARDVTIHTRLYAGNDTSGTIRWQQTSRVHRIEAGGTFQTTRRVTLSLDAALAIGAADGWVTIRTRVGAVDRRVTVTDRLEVG